MKNLVTKSHSLLRVAVLFMFALLTFLQVLDLHSTLSASPEYAEANQMINWLAKFTTFAGAVVLIKAASVAAIVALYKIWLTTKGNMDREFLLCTTTVAVVYSFVVANNYTLG